MRTPVRNTLPIIDIKSPVKGPAYIQLAQLIREKICKGDFPPGTRLPAEVTMSKTYGVAVMTVRQAIHVLAEKGLLRRVHGSGTFVCGPDFSRATFGMSGILERLSDSENVQIKILQAGITEASERIADSLDIDPGELMLTMERLITYMDKPFLLNKAYLKYEPKSTIVESEMDSSSVSSLFTGENNSFVKKSELKLEPALLTLEESGYLSTTIATPAFKISYIFYGYSDEPVGYGWFLTPRENVSFTTRIGVWDEDV
ncbi:MAG: GntR family transcriptional regulator [Deltaproteobacteria bacterium]|jgi:GntR family transcriptional regulator|nr:GntR family transcriptional regulator [Deltaproteobacteria bacterium]